MEPERLATHPHTPTRPGTVVQLPGWHGTFTVLSSFVAYQDSKPRHCYLLRDENGDLCASINTWHTPFEWVSDRLGQLQAAAREEAALREAVRRAVGED
ncbi:MULTISPECIES: hypothetical protein [Deinococcus]|uniref:Uncharacterized protein n=1 Tax=Deinococcus rufus TaxID=2136097 RepID=A0ABV7ZCR9_9DEIO|nr:hypothetical protein [Deinococcus sp. AB2017081]WQE94051.1 hypothetical protein U2P90_11590 [Deinococcus sp. AB2017081]